MKKLLTLGFPFICFLFLQLLILGCGGGKKTDQSANSAAFDSVKVPFYSGNTAVAVTHEVKNFDDWYKVYTDESDPQARLSIFASPEDPNLITVFQLTRSHEEAKNAFASVELKKSMVEAGVSSEPIYHYFDVKYRVTETTGKRYRLGVTHEVEDYERWKKIFDEDEGIRAKANLELRAISLDADNAHMVNIMFATENIEEAKSLINSDELRKRMQLAGVRSEPVFTVFVPKNP
jgi:hypothetical protein